MEDHPALYILFVIALVGIFGSIIRTIWAWGILRVIALISVLIALVSGFLWVIPGISDDILLISFMVCAFSYAIFVAFAIVTMIKSVFVTDEVTTDRIVGSVCIYLLIGMFFAFVYSGISIIDPASFDFGGSTTYKIEEFRDYIYFSYTTLTTTGFGDMLPMKPITRILAALEAITGSVYLVIMVASLVGMHVSQSINKKRQRG